MARMYFDCPIKALYMMKEFGVELVTEQGNKYWKKDILVDVDNYAYGDFKKGEKYYVDPESEAIFNPKEGDNGFDKTFGFFVCNIHKLWNSTSGIGLINQEFNNMEIIKRDGKHFFTPLTEN